jgi:hypothetical protein
VDLGEEQDKPLFEIQIIDMKCAMFDKGTKEMVREGLQYGWGFTCMDNCRFIKAPRALDRLLVGLQAKWWVASEADVKAKLYHLRL